MVPPRPPKKKNKKEQKQKQKRPHFDYTGKNILIPSKTEYVKCLMEKIETFIKRMRWKANFFLQADSTEETGTESDSDTEDSTCGKDHLSNETRRL